MERVPEKVEDTPDDLKYLHDAAFKQLLTIAEQMEVSVGNRIDFDTQTTEAFVFFHYGDGTPDEILAKATHENPIEATRQALLATAELLEARQEAKQNKTLH
ncbi:hypothetical protein HWB52_gp67 [Pseudomonas phage Littlefix]|uniref:Uncharacterized protein n=1 Tax=Pseudomonas phage Littlefix TaxID=2079289 RepID=A0A2K9VHX4_9CAUD|nr:hypothetical protein HWB52_gp67 [Pseudomonas phage Littlefix]AUV61882.1 hypothetical protein PsPhLittlefix_gp67 [Pseudomonas phage Littlefix]